MSATLGNQRLQYNTPVRRDILHFCSLVISWVAKGRLILQEEAMPRSRADCPFIICSALLVKAWKPSGNSFLVAPKRVRKAKVLRQEMELLVAEDNRLAHFEARYMK